MTHHDNDALSIPISRWGVEDRLGAANLLPSTMSPDLLRLVGEGRIIDLTQPISTESPRLKKVMSPYSMCLWSHPAASRHHLEREGKNDNAIGFADERVELDLHTGTHIDALGHVWVGDYTFNRLEMRDIATNFGLEELGIENLPAVISRGVLLDIPRLAGRELAPGEVITVDHIEGALDAQGVDLQSGDVVLIRTGWAQFYADGTDRYTDACPGIGVAGARYLADKGAAVVGSDTMIVEVSPEEVPGTALPVHQELLVRSGVYILEQADLDPAASAQVYEFLCLCLAPKFVGGTAAPVRLIAIG